MAIRLRWASNQGSTDTFSHAASASITANDILASDDMLLARGNISKLRLDALVSLDKRFQFESEDRVYEWFRLYPGFEPSLEDGLGAALPRLSRLRAVVLLFYTLPPLVY